MWLICFANLHIFFIFFIGIEKKHHLQQKGHKLHLNRYFVYLIANNTIMKNTFSLLISISTLFCVSCSHGNLDAVNDGISVECKYDIMLNWGVSSVISNIESPALDELAIYAADILHQAQKEMFDGSESKTITITATSDNLENAIASTDTIAIDEYVKMISGALAKRDEIYNAVITKRNSLKEEIVKYQPKYYLKLYDFSFFIQRRQIVNEDVLDMDFAEIKTTDGKTVEAIGGNQY